jgi:excisionase family DNA binding protein
MSDAPVEDRGSGEAGDHRTAVHGARELASVLHLDVRTIHTAAAHGELLSVRVGDQRRFPQTAVRAWLELRAADPERGG